MIRNDPGDFHAILATLEYYLITFVSSRWCVWAAMDEKIFTGEIMGKRTWQWQNLRSRVLTCPPDAWLCSADPKPTYNGLYHTVCSSSLHRMDEHPTEQKECKLVQTHILTSNACCAYKSLNHYITYI